MKQTATQRAETYLTDVLEGKILVSKMVMKAINRHFKDLETASERGLVFNPEHGDHVCKFIENFCNHSQGPLAGTPVVLEPWQCAMLTMLYSWRRKDGTRRFRYSYVELCKGQGKSFLASAIGLYELVSEASKGSEVYSVATKKDQAKIVHSEAQRMVAQSPALKARIKSFRNNLNIPGTAAKFEPLASEEDSIDGLRPSCFIADELHRWGSNAQKLWDVLANAMGKQPNPLLLVITTAGSGQESVCYQKHLYSDKVLDGIIEDETWFAWVCCLEKDEDPFDERNWIKSNPNLGVSVQIEELRAVLNRARNDPASLNGTLRLRLGLWTSTHSEWIPMDEWDKCDTVYNADDLKGQSCFAGVDLSSKDDITALSLLFPPQGDRKEWAVLTKFYLPQDNIERLSQKHRVPYEVWVRQNLFSLTPGNIVDFDYIRRDINDAATEFHLMEVAFDPYMATHFATKLQDEDGLTVVPVRQTAPVLNEPCQKLMELVLKGQLAHSANPVLRWMASNAIVHTGSTGLIHPDKGHSTSKIDGISALVTALARAIVVPIQPQIQQWSFAPFLI